jgi:hypothetical protein
LVARGRTNAQIAAELHISVRTVGSHLDRIRDKTGCRRRADLTRLALTPRLGEVGRAITVPWHVIAALITAQRPRGCYAILAVPRPQGRPGPIQ